MDEFCNVTELIVRRRLWLLDGWCGSVWQEWASLNYLISSTVKAESVAEKDLFFFPPQTTQQSSAVSANSGEEKQMRDFPYPTSSFLCLRDSRSIDRMLQDMERKKKKGCLREKLKIKKAVQPIREQTASLQGDASSELESHLLKKKKKVTQLPSDDCHRSVALTSPRSCR